LAGKSSLSKKFKANNIWFNFLRKPPICQIGYISHFALKLEKQMLIF
jgi:hypothetical protein